MSRVTQIRKYFDLPPASSNVTEYDKQHWNLYLDLLDAEVEGARRDQMTMFFENDPASSKQLTWRLVESHLSRAHWLLDSGLCLLW